MKNNYLISYNYIEQPLVLRDFNIYQIGRIICNENTVYENHFHSNYYELTIVTKGNGVLYTNNKPIPIKEGDIYLSCLYDIHAIASSKDNPLQYDFCAFYPTNSALEGELKNLASFLHPEDTRLFHSSKIPALIPLAINEVQNQTDQHALDALNCLFYQIVIYLLRKLQSNDQNYCKNISDKTILCYQIMDYINTNICKLTSLTEISDFFHLSYNYITTVFKKTTSMTLVEFYNMQRMAVAKEDILEGILTLEQIAQKLNFSTAYALSKAFKKKYNLSPRNYKNLMNK